MPVIYLFLVFFYDCYILNSVQSEILIGMQLIHNNTDGGPASTQPHKQQTHNRSSECLQGEESAAGHTPIQPSCQLPRRENTASSMRNVVSFSIFFHTFVFQEHLFLMGYRTQPAYVNKPGEKARGAKGESLLLYFT